MLAQTRLKLKNAETSLAFIQEQHAKTLEGLHKEIEQLQKKNARLTFDLAMIAPPGSKDSSRCAGCQQLEDELISSKAEVLRLSSTLSSEKDNGALLQHQLQELEAKYTTELNSKDESLQSLTAELEKKSSAVALITQQYHQLRAKFHQDASSTGQAGHHHENDEIAPANQDISDLTRAQYQFRGLRLTPNPPSGISRRTPASTQRRNFRRTTSSPVPYEVSSMTSIDGTGDGRAQPTPPISPKPLSYSSSPPALRRASKPLRKQISVRSTATLSEHSKQSLQSTERESMDRSRAVTPLEPVRRQKSGIIPAEISDIIQSSKSSSQEQVSMKQPPPVLPPIESDDYLEALSSSNNQSTPPRRHRHFILSKAQGLSSAPVVRRPMRMTCYSQARLDAMEAAQVEDEASKEGVLRVNEAEDSTWTELHQQGTDH